MSKIKLFFGENLSYEGETKDGLPHGDGTLKLKEGKSKEGITLTSKFKNGHPIGEGTYINGVGTKIIGEFDQHLNLKSNIGQLIYKNGSTWEGGIEDRLPHGEGKMKDDLGTLFIGRMDTGMFVEGTIKLKDGIVMEGKFKDLKLQGYGKMILQDGKTLEGVWREGEFVGEKK